MQICGNPSRPKRTARSRRRHKRVWADLLSTSSRKPRIYLTITRCDLSYLVDLLSKFMQTPHGINMDCAKGVLRYVVLLWFTSSSTSRQHIFDSKGTQMLIGPATKPTVDQLPDSTSASTADPYHGETKRNRQSPCRARRPNTGAQLFPHMKPFGLRG